MTTTHTGPIIGSAKLYHLFNNLYDYIAVRKKWVTAEMVAMQYFLI